jgi:hypothetical protein
MVASVNIKVDKAIKKRKPPLPSKKRIRIIISKCLKATTAADEC